MTSISFTLILAKPIRAGQYHMHPGVVPSALRGGSVVPGGRIIADDEMRKKKSIMAGGYRGEIRDHKLGMNCSAIIVF